MSNMIMDVDKLLKRLKDGLPEVIDKGVRGPYNSVEAHLNFKTEKEKADHYSSRKRFLEKQKNG